LKNAKVLEESIQSGLRSISWQFDTFAYADSYDETDDRYRGLTTAVAHVVPVSMSGPGLLVHPTAAQRQFDTDEQRAQERKREQSADISSNNGETRASTNVAETGGAFSTAMEHGSDAGAGVGDAPVKVHDPRRYFGSVTLNPQRLASQVREISQEVVSNLQGIYGAEVRISLEIQAVVPNGIPEERRRAVTENSKVLKFDQSDFADE